MTQEMSLRELIHFYDRQLEATKAADTHRYTLYGGAAGPGKSYWLRWYPIRTLMKWGMELGLTGIHGALFSKDYTTLKDRQISKMEIEVPRWLGEVKTTKADGLALHLKPRYGGHILCLRNLDDPSKYLSSEFAIIAVEEFTENEEDVFDRLRSRARWTGIENTKFIAATNPGGIGHAFVKKLWIDRNFPPELEKEKNEFIYVKALPSDNPHLAKSYMEMLDSLPERLRKAYRDGNWDVFEGQYFMEWDEAQHVVEPRVIPLNWPRFRSIDISGQSGTTSCHWYAIDSDKRVWVYREYYATGKDYADHAKEIFRLSCDRDGIPETYRYTVIDNAANVKSGFSQTPAEIYQEKGVGNFIWSSKARVPGWTVVHEYLKWDTTHRPKLQIFKTCVNMVRTLPLLIHDEKHPEDIDTRGEDHAADELRYLLITLREQGAPKPETLTERKMKENIKRDVQFNYQYSRQNNGRR